VATYGSSSKNTGKINLKPTLNKNVPQAHMGLEFDVLGVARKLVKFEVSCPKQKVEKKMLFFSRGAQIAKNHF
jgi:hypothetical protein